MRPLSEIHSHRGWYRHARLLTGVGKSVFAGLVALLVAVSARGQMDVPLFHQTGEHDCGPSAAAALLSWFQQNGYPEIKTRGGSSAIADFRTQLAGDAGTGDTGTDDSKLREAIQRLINEGPGGKPGAYRGRVVAKGPPNESASAYNDFAFIDTQFHRGFGILLLFTFDDEKLNHYVAVRNWTEVGADRALEFMDPATGTYRTTTVQVLAQRLRLTYTPPNKPAAAGLIERIIMVRPGHSVESEQADVGDDTEITYTVYFPPELTTRDLHIRVGDADILNYALTQAPNGWMHSITPYVWQEDGGPRTRDYLHIFKGASTADLSNGDQIKIRYSGDKYVGTVQGAIQQTLQGTATPFVGYVEQHLDGITVTSSKFGCAPSATGEPRCAFVDTSGGDVAAMLEWDHDDLDVTAQYEVIDDITGFIVSTPVTKSVTLPALVPNIENTLYVQARSFEDAQSPLSPRITIERTVLDAPIEMGLPQTFEFAPPGMSWHDPAVWSVSIPGATTEGALSITTAWAEPIAPLPRPLGTVIDPSHEWQDEVIRTVRPFYHLATDAELAAGVIDVAIPYVELGLTFPEENLRLLKLEGQTWVDITTNVDTTQNLIQGSTTTLGTFLIAETSTPVVTGPCMGTVDCPLAPFPWSGVAASTQVNPPALNLNGDPNSCILLTGRVLGAAETRLNLIQETQLFTDEPAIDIISGGGIASFPLTGQSMHAAGVVCLPGLAEAFAVTETSIGVVAGGVLNELTLSGAPLSAAGVSTCICPNNTFTLCVQTNADSIDTLSGGVPMSFPIGAPIVTSPLSFTNETLSGVVAFTTSESHTIIGGADIVAPLAGDFLGYRVRSNGIEVLSTNAGTVFLSSGEILAAAVVGAGVITETVLFTDAPSIDVVSAGVLNPFPLPGTEMRAGAAVCMTLGGNDLAASIAITDTAMCSVAGGGVDSDSFGGAAPVSAAIQAVCSIGNAFELCVETDEPAIRCRSAGVTTVFPIPDPIADRPLSWTNGTVSGVVVFTQTEVHVLSGGSDNTTVLPGDYQYYATGANGVTVGTTAGETFIPLATAVTIVPFGVVDGNRGSSIALNVDVCGGIAAENAGWPPAGVRCDGSAQSVAGGPFAECAHAGIATGAGEMDLTVADLPFGQGVAFTTNMPDALVIGGTLLPIGPNAVILPFADCSEPMTACASPVTISMNIAPCDDVDAAAAGWPPPGVESLFGACCLPSGECVDRITMRCCAEAGGTYLGDSSSCADPSGCCFPDGTCQMLDPECCLDIGGAPIFGACLGDGNGDGADDACVPPLPGDVDGDCDVDLADLAIVLAAFGCFGPCGPADVNGDGAVNLIDLAIVLSAYGTYC